MRATDDDLDAGSAWLAKADPAMRALVREHGPCRYPRPQRSHFRALARDIAYQQLAGAAAAAIWGRAVEALGGDVSAERMLATDEADLRAAGLSAAKLASMRDLAVHVVDGRLPLALIARNDDETIIEQLCAVRGIGRWTAQMFLLFQLRRPDIWPTGDLGVRKGYAVAHDLATMPTPKELEALGEPYRPYRSVAAWYCYRAIDGQPG